MYKWNGILKFLESRWTGFEPITTASQTKKLLLKSRTGSVFQRSAKLSYHRRLKMSDSNRSSASLTQRATLLHHILSNNPSGNRTRASGATVRRTYRYTMELYCLCRTINSSPHAAQRLALRALTKKSRLSFRTSGSLSVNHCYLSGYPVARAKAPGPRYPLDPVLLRHTQTGHSAFLAVGIIVP